MARSLKVLGLLFSVSRKISTTFNISRIRLFELSSSCLATWSLSENLSDWQVFNEKPTPALQLFFKETLATLNLSERTNGKKTV